ncbi:MAG: hypothetical protein M1834_008790 [Cirrosporium novae-zelandiae]|nr:MAG: hypothetical protein M1834_008790 [Cirrosporium novae-zelandiae]
MTTDNKGPLIETLGWVLGSLAIIVVAMRLWIRLMVVKRAGWDDFFIVFSLLSAIVCTSLDTVGVHYGLGRHYASIEDPEQQIMAYKYTVLPSIFCMVSTTTGKISIVFFLLAIMGQGGTKMKKWFLYILSLILIITNVVCIIVIIGFCVPAEKIWRPSVPGVCMTVQDQLIGAYIQASYNAISDLVLALFPITIFWPLNMDLKTKLSLTAVTGVGVFAAAATTVKAVLLQNLPNQSDITWAWAEITVWYTAEMYVIIICATIPALKPVYSVVRNKTTTHSNSYDIGGAYSRSRSRGKSMPLSSVEYGAKGSTTAPTTHAGRSTDDGSDTVANIETSSQEDILPSGKKNINIKTDVYVDYEREGSTRSGSRMGRQNYNNF